jgi:GAF domain-containing protein
MAAPPGSTKLVPASDSGRLPRRSCRGSVIYFSHDELSALADDLAEVDSVDHAARHITDFAARTFGTPHAGITLLRGGGRRFAPLAPTDPVVRRADELQDELSEGPCVDASTLGRSVVSNDVVADGRWQTWTPHVADLGLRSILSSTLQSGRRRLGALNVYGPPGHEFSSDDVERGRVLAHYASVALRLSEKVEGLRIALDTRSGIGQAQGVLMERYRIDAARAFDILKRYSQDENVRLVRVAARVVAEATGPNDDPAGPLDT